MFTAIGAHVNINLLKGNQASIAGVAKKSDILENMQLSDKKAEIWFRNNCYR
jgi:hypothetical protein